MSKQHAASANLLRVGMRRAMDDFKEHPVHTRMTSDEAAGFNH